MKKLKKAVLFGMGELADVIQFYLTHDSEYEVVAFTVDQEHKKGDEYNGLPLIAFEEVQNKYSPDTHEMFVALSYRSVNAVRALKYDQAKKKGYRLLTYINSKAITWPGLEIGDNCFIFEANVIQPFVKIGSDVIMWSGNHIGHHATIKDHCFLASHIVISGGVVVEPLTFLGVNATIRDHVTIATENVIGAGVLVLKDTNPKEVLIGEPGKIHVKKSSELKKI